MRLAFFVNDVATEVDEYTTTRLARAAAQGGHEVWYVGVGDVEHGERDGQLSARAHAAEFVEDDTLIRKLWWVGVGAHHVVRRRE
jgi:glutathione synthase